MEQLMIGLIVAASMIVVLLVVLRARSQRSRSKPQEPQSISPTSRPTIPRVVNPDALATLRGCTPLPYEDFRALNEAEKRNAFSFEGAPSSEAALAVRQVVEGIITGEVSGDS